MIFCQTKFKILTRRIFTLKHKFFICKVLLYFYSKVATYKTQILNDSIPLVRDADIKWFCWKAVQKHSTGKVFEIIIFFVIIITYRCRYYHLLSFRFLSTCSV